MHSRPIPIRQLSAQHARQDASGSFSIRSLEDLAEGQAIMHALHRHDYYLILAIRRGRGTHEIDFTSYEVHPYTIFILRPGQVHQLEISRGASGFILEFDPAFYPALRTGTDHPQQRATYRNYCPVSAARFRPLFDILSRIHDEFAERQQGYMDAIRAYLDLFFIEHLRQRTQPRHAHEQQGSYQQERYEELMRLIEAHITVRKNVSDYTALMHLSPFQLNAITKAAVGRTVSELINEHIILEARRYLLATPLQVKDIAAHLGYEDAAYFTRLFRRHTGHTPEAFRRHFR